MDDEFRGNVETYQKEEDRERISDDVWTIRYKEEILEDEGSIGRSSDERSDLPDHRTPGQTELHSRGEELFQEMFLDKSLMGHLLEVEETARKFIDETEMMESFGLTEKLRQRTR